MSKFSVKKPFSVFVCVIIILILGIVSYTKMTPDLLPDMDLPYVVVMTPYVGAAPEKVETAVTRPMEASMATLTGIKNISSVSAENYAMVILEFEQETNMDTISVDILQKINTISAGWDDFVGTPVILKINPSMLPVMVAAVSKEDLSGAVLTQFLEDNVVGKLEGTPGIASVSASGLVEEQINVVIAQKKIDALTEKIYDAIDAQFYPAEQKIKSAKKEITQAKNQVEQQISQIQDNPYLTEEQKQLAIDQIYDSDEYQALLSTEKQLSSSQKELSSAKAQAKQNINLSQTLTMDSISAILTAQNFSMPAGYVSQNGVDYLVRVSGEMESLEEIQNLVLFDSGIEDVGKIRLKDVADVFISDNTDAIYAKVNGEDGVLFTFSKQSTYSTAKASDNLHDTFAALEEAFPGLSFSVMMDQGEYIYLVMDAIMENLLLGALFAIIILALFLKDVRPTLITLVSIPISVIFALALMYFSGVSLNIISLSGLAVSVGMLVDNSIVVIENVYRLKGEGVPILKAAVAGASQVAGAITSSTLTTVCVFLPIVFVEGITKQLFTDMALTVGYSLLASLIVALTVVPAMSTLMLKNAEAKPQKLMDRVYGWYEKSVRFALGKKGLVLLLCIAILLGIGAAEISRGFLFMPSMNTTQLSVQVTMPEGSTFQQTRQTADEVMRRIRAIEGVKTVGAMVADTSSGEAMMQMGSAGDISLYVILEGEGDYSSDAVALKINEACRDMQAIVEAQGSGSMTTYQSALGGSGISVDLYCDDLDLLQTYAREIAEVLKGVAGVETVDDGIGETEPEIRFVVDQNKAMRNGLTSAQVYQGLVEAMQTSSDATTVSFDEGEYGVVVKEGAQDALSVKEIKNLSLSVDTPAGTKKVKLADVADIEETQGLSSIARYNQRRMLTVSAAVKEGYNVTLVTSQAKEALRAFETAEGLSIEFRGENETIMQAMGDLMLMMLLGIVFVYLVMVAQFQSLKSPFIVMFTIPLALTGGLLGLFVCGMEVSVVSMIGFVMLCGIIVNNGIVLVDYINQLRQEGVPKHEAIVKAGIVRMRPILMTTITTVLGLIMMALSQGLGTDLMRPVAVVCISGLLYATLLTLYVVPVMYDLLNRGEMRIVKEEDVTLS